MALVSTSQAADIDGRLSPAQLVALAQALNNQARYAEAADLLERALMLNPNVSEGLGAYQYALQSMGANQRAFANNRLNALRQAKWQVSKQISIKGGVSNNLNRAPSNSVIPLTIGAQTVQLTLAPNEREKSGQAVELGVSVAAQAQVSAKEAVSVSAQWQQREASKTGSTNFQWGKVAATWQRDLPKKHQLIVGLSVDVLKYQQQNPHYIMQAALRYKLLQQQYCSQQYGIEAQSQGQQKNKALDGRYLGAVLALNCQMQNSLYGAQLSVGQDWAVGKRLGGDQRTKKIQLSHLWDMAKYNQGDSISTTLNYYHQQDKAGYSELFNAGSKRTVERINVVVEYATSLAVIGKNWKGFIALEWMQQRSNLVLFETKTKELWLGLRRSW